MNKQEHLDAIVREVIKCKQKIAIERQTIVDLRQYALQSCGCDPKEFNTWANQAFGGNCWVDVSDVV